MNSIPIVDCCNQNLNDHRSAILTAIWDVGFVYLKNCGIDADKDALKASRTFFALPSSEKQQYLRNDDNWGYVNPGMETLTEKPVKSSQIELRESFNVPNFSFQDETWPTQVPDFQLAIKRLWQEGEKVAMQLLKMIGQKLDDDNEQIIKSHDGLGSRANSSAIRLLHYPPVPDEFAVDVARCGEHSDYGSVTLLWQDDVGGLEVQNTHGEFVQASPVEGAVLVNTGDMLERWSDGAVKAVRHRVRTPPQSDARRAKDRYSAAFFVHPDDAAVVTPLNGSSRYPPVSGKQYLVDQYAKTYGK